jgi:hypothetical protein
MRLVFAIAIALALLGTANAANLRRAAAEIGVTAADTRAIATLKAKYDCRQAGASLAETLQNIAIKNGQRLVSHGIECKERTDNITTSWTNAQKNYATELLKVETYAVEQFSTAKKAANKTFQTLVQDRNDAVGNQQIEYTREKELIDTAVVAYLTAEGAWNETTELKKTSEKEFKDVTLPAGNKLNANTFEASKQIAAAAMNELITTATEVHATADGFCTGIKTNREQHISDDEDLLNVIGPLIKELSELKCVDNYDDAKTAGDTTAPAAVETKVAEAIVKGAKSIKMTDATTKGFKIGQTIQIGNEERTITGIGDSDRGRRRRLLSDNTITLDRALDEAHAIGETIVVQEAPTVADAPGAGVANVNVPGANTQVAVVADAVVAAT